MDEGDITLGIRAHAEAHPEAVALNYPRGKRGEGWNTLTYTELEHRIEAFSQGYRRLGFESGDRVLLMFAPSLQFYPAIFGLLRAGLVPVFIDPAMGIGKVLACVESIKPRALIAPAALHTVSLFLRSTFKSVDIRIVAGRWSWLFGPTLTQLERATRGTQLPECNLGLHDDASIVFTSGSTGPPKAVVMSRYCMAERIRALEAMLKLAPETQVVETLLVYTILWLSMGLTVSVPEIDVKSPSKADPEAVVDAILKFKPNFASASLIVWQKLVRYAETHKTHFPSLKTLLTSSAPIPVSLHKRLRAFVNEEVELYTPYGATEALPVTNIGTQEILGGTAEATMRGEGICLGHAAPGMEIRIIALQSQELPTWDKVQLLEAGEIGEVVVCGGGVSTEYRNAPGANEKSKIHEGELLWHRMGDLGYLDSDNRLWFCGRTMHRLDTENGLVPAVPVEQIFLQHPAVFRAALVGVGRAGKERGVLCVELEGGQSWSEEVALDIICLSQGTRWEGVVEEAVHYPNLPTDPRHNSKIIREEVKEWVSRRHV
ncbi:MAG: AMP-binding protein [Myxococcota bacterium]|nr:AMP-binding protein [Myxococcota bacterium]